jgi:hypothetical protein
MSAYIFLGIRLAIFIALFSFLGFALWTLWKDLRLRSQKLSSTQTPPIVLQRSIGDEIHTNRFEKQVIIIGRDPACEWRLPDLSISGRHARLIYHHNQWWVEDLGSKNGTYLNDDPVTTPLVLTNGDQLRFGELVFDLIIDRASAEN